MKLNLFIRLCNSKKRRGCPALKKINEQGNWGTSDRSTEQNKIYCSKLELRIKEPFENGRLSKSGDKTDLDNLRITLLKEEQKNIPNYKRN